MKLLPLLAAATLPAVAPAQAVVYTFDFSGSGISASGTFTATDAADSSGFHTITAISGTQNGLDMSLLAPGSFPTLSPNDNLVSPTAPYLTFNGFSFAAGGQDYNVFYRSAVSGFVECQVASCTEGTASEVALGSFSVAAAPVPEPATWEMAIGGFGLLGFSLRRARQLAVRFA